MNEDRPLMPPRRSGAGRAAAIVGVVAVLLALGGGVWWWLEHRAAAPVVALSPVTPVTPVTPPMASVDAPASSPPIEPPAPPTAPLVADEVDAALAALLGTDAVKRWLRTDDFARRLVATVDNLGRAQAPASAWPLKATDGRFTVAVRDDGSSVIAAANAARYTPFVVFLESVDPAAAVALYARLYPLLQQAWVDLGYPRGRFNDRLVQVIDLLLATPLPDAPPVVRLVEVKGPIAPTRPWVRYEFADPELEALAAGQKALLRVGPEHARRLKARLAALRDALRQAAATPPR